nr:hypothetical protein [Comamonas jiangduensis]
MEQFTDPGGQSWWTASIQVPDKATQDMRLLLAVPEMELTAAARQQLQWSTVVTLSIILLSMPVAWLLAQAISRPLRRLALDVQAIEQFDFEQPIQVDSLIKETHELGVTLQSMQDTIRRFLDLSMAVAAEEQFDRLLPRLLKETMLTASAASGLLYLADGDQLYPACGRLADGTALDDQALATLATIPLPPSTSPDPCSCGPLLERCLRENAVTSQPLTIADIQGLQLAPSAIAQGLSHSVVIPLLNRRREYVGAMVLFMPSPPVDTQVAFVAALSGNAAVSLEARALIEQQKKLFTAFIELIAGAIDAKSPYTASHCARVPELTKMLAQAACDQTDGAFADFALSAHDWEAVHVASWLHDCGKVTTPEFVVDKATKLETIYNRIHEVRMRFEVLKRDAHITMYEAIAAGAQPEQARAAMLQTCRELDEEFAFVAACNQGGEKLGAAEQERLRHIAQRTWTRTLDDTLGISLAEAQRQQSTPLPAQELLLADKPAHRIERSPHDQIAPDNV